MKDKNSKILREKEFLNFYNEKIQKLDFFSTKPVNAMIHRFLINKMLYKIYDEGPQPPENLIDCVYAEEFPHKKPKWLIDGTYYPFARFFSLVKKNNKGQIKLSKLGKKYVESDKSRPKDISKSQARIIRAWIINNPFKSKVLNGICNFVDSILELMRNEKMIPDSNLLEFFIIKSGKFFEWSEEGTRRTQFNNYRNLSEELGLIETINDRMYITPLGYSFIMQLQINRVREMLNLL